MVGSLTEDLLLRHLANDDVDKSSVVGEIQGPPFPTRDADTSTRDVYPLFENHTSAVAVKRGEALEGIVTKSDLLDFWAHQRGS